MLGTHRAGLWSKCVLAHYNGSCLQICLRTTWRLWYQHLCWAGRFVHQQFCCPHHIQHLKNTVITKWVGTYPWYTRTFSMVMPPEEVRTLRSGMRTHARTHACADKHTHTWEHTHVDTRARTCTRAQADMYKCTRTHPHAHACRHIHAHACARVRTHTHTHTEKGWLRKRSQQLTQQPVLLHKVNIKNFLPIKVRRIKWHNI